MKIDMNFDFTIDTPHYWDNFWDKRNGLGVAGNDPDSSSKTLQKYHQIIWSKKLPCGDDMKLQCGSGSNYLTWKNFRFGSDSIFASFRYEKYRYMLDKVKKSVFNYHAFVEKYLHESYTIGGTIIFPKHSGSFNQMRGTNIKIRDRWDLSLECIRRYYKGENSPLYQTILNDKDFFDLFVDFKGYVNYFFLQDCVTDDYSEVKFWIGEGDLNKDPFPNTVDEYLQWIEKQMICLKKRNKRIAEAMG